MKMISIDDLIEYCDNERTAYKANNCGAACTALRRLVEFAKEYAVEAEPVKHGQMIPHTDEAITREQFSEAAKQLINEFTANDGYGTSASATFLALCFGNLELRLFGMDGDSE